MVKSCCAVFIRALLKFQKNLYKYKNLICVFRFYNILPYPFVLSFLRSKKYRRMLKNVFLILFFIIKIHQNKDGKTSFDTPSYRRDTQDERTGENI